MSFILDMPEFLQVELLTQYFTLPELTRIDTAFCNSTLRPFLLKTYGDKHFVIDGKRTADAGFDEVLTYISRRKLRVRNLYVCGNYTVNRRSKKDKKATSVNCEMLQTLIISNCQNAQHQYLRMLLKTSSVLKSLSVSESPELTVPMLRSSKFRPVFEQLVELSIARCANFEAEGLECLSSMCTQLERFSLSSSVSSFHTPSSTTMSSLLALVQSNNTLISFKIELPNVTLTDALLVLLTGTCTQLQEINIVSDNQFQLKQTAALLVACKDMHTLEFRPRPLFGAVVTFIRYRKFTRKNSNRVVTYHKHFESIRYTDDGLSDFFYTVPDFHYIDIKYNIFLTDAVLSILADKSPHLTSLYIDQSPLSTFTPVGVANIFSKCRDLSAIELKGVDQFSHDDMLMLFSIPKHLKKVTVFHSTLGTQLSDLILRLCPTIRRYSQGD